MQDNISIFPSRSAAEAEQPSSHLHARLHNLPAQLTPLLGREHEVQAICAFLRCPEVRLVTLTGTGGVGKTCLGLQIVAELLDDFVNGVYFVPLAPISDPNLVIPTIARTLDLKEAGDRPLVEHLKAYLREKQRLLLLDNFEQVVTAAPILVELLQTCPKLKILVTSRAVLHVSGEHEFAVPPLAVPDLKHLPASDVLMQYAAVALFVQRAGATKPDFQITSANARAVAEISIRLDGLPLAIELAAARIKLLSPQALLVRLSHRLQVLTGGVRDAPVRQQTLRNTVAWSYDLLTAEEQRLFRRLAVFVGGCTLEAVEAVCEVLGDETGKVFDGVASLMDKSLVQQQAQRDEEPRLMMLETIREFGLESLLASGEMETVRQAYATYYLTLAETAAPHLTSNQQTVWLARLEREHQNLRVALNWALEQNEAEIALRFCLALWWYWVAHGHLKEGRHFLEKALAGNLRGERDMMHLRGRTLYAAGIIAWIQGDYDHAEVFCRESLALCREFGDQRGIGSALHGLGRVAIARRNYAEARSLVEESLVILRELGDTWEVAYVLESLALVTLFEGEDTRALKLLQESLALFRELGDKGSISWILLSLARVRIKCGDQTIARSLLEEAFALCKELGNKWGMAGTLGLLGQLAFEQGDVARTRSLLEESVLLHREGGDQRSLARTLLFLANLVAFQGEATVARKLYEECLAMASILDHAGTMASCLEGLGGVIASQQPAWAARLWGKAENLRITTGVSMPVVMRAYYEGIVATVHAMLGEKAFTTAWAEGRAMTLEQVLAARGPATLPQQETAELQPTTEKAVPAYPAGLTEREVEVLRLVAQGLTTPQIAKQLIVSPHTVNAHMRSIFNKLGVSSRSAVTRFAVEHQLV